MNIWEGIGRLTKDPEIKYAAGGTAVCKFSLAINRPKTKDGKEETDFINCVAFAKRAETIANYVKKGQQFAVSGPIRTGSFKDKDGNTRYTTDIWVENFTFISNGKNEGKSAASSEDKDVSGFYSETDDEEVPF